MSILDELRNVVGSDRIVYDSSVLNSFARDNSFVIGETPECIVKPGNMSEVQKIVKLANEKGFSLIPCSSKGPHFRGETVPTGSESVIVDLSEMRSIVRMDRRNKVAIVEPGVTFDELIAEAGKEGLRVLMPLLPRKTKSVLGSYLEREPITIPKYHWDMTDPLLCTEVVFGTGDLFRTGSAAGPGSLEEQWASGQAQKNPMGPAQTDFVRVIQGSQGTMGIVTWGSIKLELLPAVEKIFFISGENGLDGLIDFTYRILKPKLPDECLILNRVDFASIYRGDSKEIGELCRNLPEWILIYSIGGYEYFPEERVDYIEKDIADIAVEIGVKPVQSIRGISGKEIIGLIRMSSDEPYWKYRYRGGCQDGVEMTSCFDL